MISIFDERGYMNSNCGKFAKMHRYDARNAIMNELKDLNLFRKITNHSMVIPICSRTGDVIELLLRPQWFVNCQDLAKSAVEDVKNGVLEIEPKHFEQNWFNWLNGIRY